jgi:hypothetical protein
MTLPTGVLSDMAKLLMSMEKTGGKLVLHPGTERRGVNPAELVQKLQL